MVLSDENKPINNTTSDSQGAVIMADRKFGQEINQNRRALSVINHDLLGSKPYPCVVNKRPLQEKNALCDKGLLDPVNRPLTRKYAAEIASNQQPLPVECKKLKPSAPNTNEFGECIFIDDDEFGECIFIDDDESKASADKPVPMSLEKTSSKPEHFDQMEEVEMEDIVAEEEEEPILDIDGFDARNPLAAVEYVEDMYAFFKRVEGIQCALPNYMAQQFDINKKMRAILIDWLIEVHNKFELMDETLYLTVNLLDRFLSRQSVVRKKLQLVGLVALLLACKYEEVSVPIVGDLILISDKAYDRNDFLQMEKLMVNTLQFNMSVPTPYVFMRRFLKAAQADKKLEMLSFFLIELALVEYEMLKFQPSLLAASAIYTAQCTLYGFKQWSRTCQWHSGYSEQQLLECSRLIVGFHQSAATGKLMGVHRKYCTTKFGYTAKFGPALSLLVGPATTQQ